MRNWKKYEEAKNLRDTGLTLKAIGAVLGVSGARVGEMLSTLKRREDHASWEAEDKSRIPWHRGLKINTYWILNSRGFDSRESCVALAADDLTMWRGSVALPGWEADKDSWAYSKRKLKLKIVNEVRAWLGVKPYVPGRRVASDKELERARMLLERHGWSVYPPNVKLTGAARLYRAASSD